MVYLLVSRSRLGGREHRPDVLRVGFRHESGLLEASQAARVLLREDVALHRVAALELAGGGLVEPLRRAAVRLSLSGHVRGSFSVLFDRAEDLVHPVSHHLGAGFGVRPAFEVLDEPVENLPPVVEARHLAAAELDGGLHLVALLQEPEDVLPVSYTNLTLPT